MDVKHIVDDEKKFLAMTYNGGLGSGMSPVEYHRWTEIIQQLLRSRRKPSVLPHVIGFYLADEEPCGCFSNGYNELDGTFTIDGVTFVHHSLGTDSCFGGLCFLCCQKGFLDHLRCLHAKKIDTTALEESVQQWQTELTSLCDPGKRAGCSRNTERKVEGDWRGSPADGQRAAQGAEAGTAKGTGHLPMNVFEAVKSSVTTREAAQHYGIEVTHNGMAGCPFHADRHPSMKLDARYYCVGCGVTGDVIDFVSGLFGLSMKDAAVKLAQDFDIAYESRYRPQSEPASTMKQQPVPEKPPDRTARQT